MGSKDCKRDIFDFLHVLIAAGLFIVAALGFLANSHPGENRAKAVQVVTLYPDGH
jgi:type II secretory pathway component PulF